VLLFQPFHGDSKGRPVIVTIPKGAGLATVADLLAAKGIVDDATLFALRTRIEGDSGAIHAGPIAMRTGLSYGEALDILTKQGNATKSVTIPEGPSRQEVAPIVAGAGVSGNYLAATRSSRFLDPRAYGAPAGTGLDGFLFPSTYDLRLPPRVSELLQAQLAAFKSQFATVDMAKARAKNLTPFDVVTIASMIERETSVARERPLVAAVIWNRLKQGIPLGIDATTRYEFSNWTEPIRQSQLASTSRWNTRNRQGLPPGPIGNPGLESLKAAANPAASDFLYYVVKPWTCGEHTFARTQPEFDRAVAAYNSAREANGGKAPSKCP
jgi:UPF0755 protein